ncbi:MAG: integration host factor subunit alpha [Deltaproteobacteria bacterium]|nr:integration host factor subunit alpha [Deltaproteobacteria bacterium]
MALTKSDIVDMVCELGFTKKESVRVVEELIEIIKQNLQDGDDVLISGFGKFCVKEKTPRRGRNPATGSDLMLRSRRVVTFKCSGKLRDKINGKLPVKSGSSNETKN